MAMEAVATRVKRVRNCILNDVVWDSLGAWMQVLNSGCLLVVGSRKFVEIWFRQQ
jgi:hypothetical protein